MRSCQADGRALKAAFALIAKDFIKEARAWEGPSHERLGVFDA
jgi:hypothetical protein